MFLYLFLFQPIATISICVVYASTLVRLLLCCFLLLFVLLVSLFACTARLDGTVNNIRMLSVQCKQCAPLSAVGVIRLHGEVPQTNSRNTVWQKKSFAPSNSIVLHGKCQKAADEKKCSSSNVNLKMFENKNKYLLNVIKEKHRRA